MCVCSPDDDLLAYQDYLRITFLLLFMSGGKFCQFTVNIQSLGFCLRMCETFSVGLSPIGVIA